MRSKVKAHATFLRVWLDEKDMRKCDAVRAMHP